MKSSAFSDSSTLIVFTTSTAGLGHLRVTSALAQGLSPHIHSVVLGSHDPQVAFFHRLTSVNALGKAVMEAGQSHVIEGIFTSGYRRLMRQPSRKLYEELSDVFRQQLKKPKKILIVATHFGLAHQVAVLKQRLEAEFGMPVKLIVQVTDDTAQYPWYVDGADLILVPSDSTREQLQEYGREARLHPVQISVTPYPISPRLGGILSKSDYANRVAQMDPKGKVAIELSVPVSGAAVGLEYKQKLLSALNESRLHLNVVSRDQLYTQPFLMFAKSRPHVHIYSSISDREVVSLYDEMFMRQVIGFEITKPSEQVFKVLFTPRQRGGVILLLAAPVGRQEWDNLEFLRRHLLMPNETAEGALWDLAKSQLPLTNALRQQSKYWRALALPKDPVAAAVFIEWAKNVGLFMLMLQATGRPHSLDAHKHELGSDGVAQFWKRVEKLLK